MCFTLAPGISFCEPDGQRIFLDLYQDRYFALGGTANSAFTRLLTGDRLSAADRDRLAQLKQAGVLCATDNSIRPTPCTAPPTQAAILDRRDLPAVSAVRTIGAALALRRAKREVGRVPLDRLCARFVAEKRIAARSRHAADDSASTQLAIAFQLAARVVGALDQCLALSLALGRRAVAIGLPADLVLGVRARPFHAHAWVQIDGVVISDRLDNIRPYTPILVL